jgi:Pretoxin HINT domain
MPRTDEQERRLAEIRHRADEIQSQAERSLGTKLFVLAAGMLAGTAGPGIFAGTGGVAVTAGSSAGYGIAGLGAAFGTEDIRAMLKELKALEREQNEILGSESTGTTSITVPTQVITAKNHDERQVITIDPVVITDGDDDGMTVGPVTIETEGSGGSGTTTIPETTIHGDPGGCFTAGTPVLLADGLKVPIETVLVGDLVLARDEVSGETAPCPITKTFRHEVSETLVLRLGGGGKIETTGAHRFAVAGRGFQAARKLRSQDSLLTRDGSLELVDSAAVANEAAVFNLEVAKSHTYFIGSEELWVHNLKDSEPDELEDGDDEP